MVAENWKDVNEFPDLFMVSDLGNVWSKRTNRILKPTKLKNGYLTISSKIGGRKGRCICKRIHRWVAEAFIDNPENKPFVNHKDGVKTNNHKDNLEWCTASENTTHAYSIGLIEVICGEQSVNSKLTDDQVNEILEMKGKLPQREIGKIYNISHTVVGSIHRGDSWKHIMRLVAPAGYDPATSPLSVVRSAD